MPRRPPPECKYCGAHWTTVHHISRNGLCNFCAEDRLWDNAVQLHNHEGPFFASWLFALNDAVLKMLRDLDESLDPKA